METYQTVTVKQLERFPVYLKYLYSMRDSGIINITSPIIARALNLTEEQVRKDLQVVSLTSGKPNQGRLINDLIEDIENFLGYNDVSNAVVIGAGNLGEAFMKYKGFEEYGLKILAAFDVDTQKIGLEVGGKKIFPLSKLEDLIKRLNVHIAILTVPQEVANEVCERLVEAGIKAIWNFVPTHLYVSKDIIVENVNLASSLAVLSHRLLEKKGE